MLQPREVHVAPRDLSRYRSLIATERFDELISGAASARALLRTRAVWNINSTATGGGVAEMLRVIVGYATGAGIDARWLVMDGDSDFFKITKRIHNRLHGAQGDEGDLGPSETSHFQRISHENNLALTRLVRPGDLALLHDPQTVGLAPALSERGVIVVWRCHVGSDVTNRWSEEAWEFLRPFLDPCRELVFSRATYAPAWAEPSKVTVILPSIDPFSPKNRRMTAPYVHERLFRLGLLRSPWNGTNPHTSTRPLGFGGPSGGGVIRGNTRFGAETPLVLQVSRWDRLKDIRGVMNGFASAEILRTEAHLALVGPTVAGVVDDPEGAAVLAECVDAWERLPHRAQERIHLVSLDIDDPDENALLVNALQRFASVIVQKSLAEGFGLTVVEGMWKQRAVVASAVGGIVDQLTDDTGVLLSDPADLDAFAGAVANLLGDRTLRSRLGHRARQRAFDRFVGDRHLLAYAHLFRRVLDGDLE